FFFFQAEDGIRDGHVTGVQTCALPIFITLGSPFSGDPRQNNVWRLYEWIARHKVTDPPIPRITKKPPVPQLALWSRNDGLIAPRSEERRVGKECRAGWARYK